MVSQPLNRALLLSAGSSLVWLAERARVCAAELALIFGEDSELFSQFGSFIPIQRLRPALARRREQAKRQGQRQGRRVMAAGSLSGGGVSGVSGGSATSGPRGRAGWSASNTINLADELAAAPAAAAAPPPATARKRQRSSQATPAVGGLSAGLSVGVAVLVRSPDDGEWYPGAIKRVNKNSDVRVLYPETAEFHSSEETVRKADLQGRLRTVA